jgi:hypothetical protein
MLLAFLSGKEKSQSVHVRRVSQPMNHTVTVCAEDREVSGHVISDCFTLFQGCQGLSVVGLDELFSDRAIGFLEVELTGLAAKAMMLFDQLSGPWIPLDPHMHPIAACLFQCDAGGDAAHELGRNNFGLKRRLQPAKKSQREIGPNNPAKVFS